MQIFSLSLKSDFAIIGGREFDGMIVANYRPVHTKFWSDPWVVSLTPQRKFLYLYLFTNEHTSDAGFYPLSLRTIAEETALDIRTIKKAIKFFESEGKISYDWDRKEIWVKNFLRYQSISRITPGICKGIASLQHTSSMVRAYLQHTLAYLLQIYTGEEPYVIEIIKTIKTVLITSDQDRSDLITNLTKLNYIYPGKKISPKEMREKLNRIIKEIK